MSELESYLSTIGPDLQNMTRLFGLPDSVWEHPVFSYTVREEHGQFFCVFRDEEREVEGHAPVPEMTGDARLDLLHRKRVLRRLCRQTLYDLLRVRTGMHPPWGSMTGIRPTRLMVEALEGGKTFEEAEADLIPVGKSAAVLLRQIHSLQHDHHSLFPEIHMHMIGRAHHFTDLHGTGQMRRGIVSRAQ